MSISLFDLFAGILTCQFGGLAAPPYLSWGGITVKEKRIPVLRQRWGILRRELNFLNSYGPPNEFEISRSYRFSRANLNEMRLILAFVWAFYRNGGFDEPGSGRL